jgi:hypothetical protein
VRSAVHVRILVSSITTLTTSSTRSRSRDLHAGECDIERPRKHSSSMLGMSTTQSSWPCIFKDAQRRAPLRASAAARHGDLQLDDGELDGPFGGGSSEAARGRCGDLDAKPSYPGAVMQECELGARKLRCTHGNWKEHSREGNKLFALML